MNGRCTLSKKCGHRIKLEGLRPQYRKKIVQKLISQVKATLKLIGNP